MTGKVCDKHQEWCPTGECRWCEPAEPIGLLPAPEVPSFAKAAQAMIDAAKARIYAGWMLTDPGWVGWPHYPSCPLTGQIGDPAQALAAGCTCVPFP